MKSSYIAIKTTMKLEGIDFNPDFVKSFATADAFVDAPCNAHLLAHYRAEHRKEKMTKIWAFFNKSDNHAPQPIQKETRSTRPKSERVAKANVGEPIAADSSVEPAADEPRGDINGGDVDVSGQEQV